MIYALVTAICWSISGFASSRLSRNFGATTANLLRLSIATVLLACICLVRGSGLWHSGCEWFMLAGIMHLCIGDMGLFGAFRRLGPRLGVLMVGSLAPPTALLSEWLLMGTIPGKTQLLCAGGILLLVAIAVAPKERQHLSARELKIGLTFGCLAALGQGLSATLQRFGNAQVVHLDLDPWLVIFTRVSAGTLGVFLWILLLLFCKQHPFRKPSELIPHCKFNGHPSLWLGISSCMGPIVGMFFLISALSTTSASLVQAGIATMPVFMMPVAWILDGNAPSVRSVFAGIGAVALTILLIML